MKIFLHKTNINTSLDLHFHILNTCIDNKNDEKENREHCCLGNTQCLDKISSLAVKY